MGDAQTFGHIRSFARTSDAVAHGGEDLGLDFGHGRRHSWYSKREGGEGQIETVEVGLRLPRFRSMCRLPRSLCRNREVVADHDNSGEKRAVRVKVN